MAGVRVNIIKSCVEVALSLFNFILITGGLVVLALGVAMIVKVSFQFDMPI